MKNVERKREVRETEAPTDTLRRIVNIIFTLAGLLLIFRFVFLLLGANPNNGFVDAIYGITEPFVMIFSGIFAERSWSDGVLEPASLLALVVLFIVSWLVQSLFAKRTVRREEYTASERRDDAPRTQGNVTTNETVRKEGTRAPEESTEKEVIREDREDREPRN